MGVVVVLADWVLRHNHICKYGSKLTLSPVVVFVHLLMQTDASCLVCFADKLWRRTGLIFFVNGLTYIFLSFQLLITFELKCMLDLDPILFSYWFNHCCNKGVSLTGTCYWKSEQNILVFRPDVCNTMLSAENLIAFNWVPWCIYVLLMASSDPVSVDEQFSIRG